MNNRWTHQVKQYLKSHRKDKRFRISALALSVCTILIVYGCMCLPALGLEATSLNLTSENSEAAPGQNITVHIAASARENQDSTFFYLDPAGTGPQLASGYVFTNVGDHSSDDTTTAVVSSTDITAADGSVVTFYRSVLNGETGYWFELKQGTSADFTVDFTSDAAQTLALFYADGSTLDSAQTKAEQIKTEDGKDQLVLTWKAQEQTAVQETDETAAVTASADDDIAAIAETSTSNQETITTEDTRSEGVTMNLFDYNANDTQYNYFNDAYNGSFTNSMRSWDLSSLPTTSTVFKDMNGNNTGNTINLDDNGNPRELLFFAFGTGLSTAANASSSQTDKNAKPISTSNTINTYTGTEEAMAGIVKNTLTDGYPYLNTTGGLSGNKSLSYLFDTTATSGKKTVYSDVNHLFKQETDKEGYLIYDSDSNYAYYNSDTNGGDFKVYKDTYLTNQTDYTHSIGFFPFNDYNTSNNDPSNSSWRKSDTGALNHHFGMTMEADFTLPTDADGKINGQDMVFNYSGDDDMWVFIDDVLVLDLGGIHQPADGNINFTTGEVTTTDAAEQVVKYRNNSAVINQTQSLESVFNQAGKTYDSSKGSQHTLKVFYLERGGTYSNLKIEFNLQLYKKGDLAITKKITGDEDYSDEEKAALKDKTYQTQLYLEDEAGTDTYSVYKGPATYDDGSDVTFDSDGTFSIKADQTVTVKDLNVNQKYYLKEIGVDGALFDQVTIGDTTTTVSGTTTAQSETKKIAELNPVTIDNHLKAKPSLFVEKLWYNPDGTEKDQSDVPDSINFELYRSHTVESAEVTHKVTFYINTYYGTTQKQEIEVADGGSADFYSYYQTRRGGGWGGGQTYYTSPDSVSTDDGTVLTRTGTGGSGYTQYNKYTLSNITGDTSVTCYYNSVYDDSDSSSFNLTVSSYTRPTGQSTSTTETEDLGQFELNKGNNWQWSSSDYPSADDSGNPYTYYVNEDVLADYSTEYDNNNISKGTIQIKNTYKYSYELPSTGSNGPEVLEIVGTILTAGAVLFVLINRSRRKTERRI